MTGGETPINQELNSSTIPEVDSGLLVSKKRKIKMAYREPERAIIVPRTDDKHWWERNGVFNPGVAVYKDNIILLYRAYDEFRISRLGLAYAKDGMSFTCHDNPAIDTDPNDPSERLGIEDPRITEINGTYYIVHTVASYQRIGHSSDVRGVKDHIPWRIRVAMHTTTDFRSFNHWGMLFPELPAKNACLLPEKINDSFGMYYREHCPEGEILKLSYTKDFKVWTKPQTIVWPHAEAWQGAKFGAGSQPIVTKEGLLMVYHAVDNQQVYRLGLMMFDRNDPSKLLWYSDPVLEPEMTYEKQGYIPNVVYTCGAVIRNDELWIYYGAADSVIGRAVLPMSDIL